MRGVRIEFDNPNIKTIWPVHAAGAPTNPNCAVPAGRSRFAYYFEPICPLMTDLFWFAHGWQSSPFVDLIFEPGGEERLDRYQVDHPGFDDVNASLLRPGCLPALADWLRDDWINLLGFAPGGGDPGEIADALFGAGERGQEGYYAAIEQQVSLCFFCVDGGSWEFYSKDQGAVTQVFEHVGPMEGVKRERVHLLHRERRFR